MSGSWRTQKADTDDCLFGVPGTDSSCTECLSLMWFSIFVVPPVYVSSITHNWHLTVFESLHRLKNLQTLVVAFSQPYLSKFNSNTLLIVQYFKFKLCSYQFNHFVWLTLLNLQVSALPGE